jgi:hypothetical protein
MAHLSWRSVLKRTKMLSVRPELTLFCYFGVWNRGEAFLDKASTLYAQLKARMLRPYKNPDSFPEITKEGLKQKQPQITAAKAAVNLKPAQTGYCTYAITFRRTPWVLHLSVLSCSIGTCAIGHDCQT